MAQSAAFGVQTGDADSIGAESTAAARSHAPVYGIRWHSREFHGMSLGQVSDRRVLR